MLTVNDEPLEHEEAMTVADLLARLGFTSRMLAVWIDGELVPRDAYETTPVPDGADIKVVHMIAGG
jgi:thiamine biosynthesis protein ThiS